MSGERRRSKLSTFSFACNKKQNNMKKLKFGKMMLSAVLVIPLLFACGGDDDSSNKNNQTTLVDGVNVNKRKILTLEVTDMDKSLGLYKITYDSKGRLTQIDIENWGIGLRIDYDLCIMEYYDGLGINAQGKLEKYYAKCRFTLNERGFISQISNCECTYNSEGYLTGVKTFVDWWTFAYNNGDVAKAMVEVFKSGNMDLYYVYYGEKKNEGELYITCKELEYTGFKFHRSVMAMIAYHAGLFGNISKHCTTLPNTADAKTFIELSSWNSSKRKSEDMTLSCKFTFSD